jgi:hypothetical protein
MFLLLCKYNIMNEVYIEILLETDVLSIIPKWDITKMLGASSQSDSAAVHWLQMPRESIYL